MNKSNLLKYIKLLQTLEKAALKLHLFGEANGFPPFPAGIPTSGDEVSGAWQVYKAINGEVMSMRQALQILGGCDDR